MKTKKAFLVLSDGRSFEGQKIGYDGPCRGELVFTTGMVGYVETLTDPSYYGQIILQTFPLIGNYGIIPEDFEGGCFARGYVVREACSEPSNFRCAGTLDAFLKEHHIPGICGIDTREVTRIIREEGVMNACICDSLPADLEAIRNERISGAVHAVSRRQIQTFPCPGQEQYHVVLMDYGAKQNIIRSLLCRHCRVTVVPHDTPADAVFALHPDGVMLSNGPGDPADNTFEIGEIRKMIGRVPVFGICLGHQLTALAMGGKTEKLKYGHRGANQPVRKYDGSRTYITSQNHGYAVVRHSLDGVARETYLNANDESCEGLDYPGLDCFTVQFHPEACSGPLDTGFLFDDFVKLMGGRKNAEKS